ncbi:CZB domain-containing protein [Undibacterium jejuense]|uniref:CZB domain-containing protein n=2 Tax=Undibacterium jejuense TaxID=1344949 RepID=A0A923HD57_9BURK|nr:CZB domain-containing protein [Undibacterium jejuense]MBC3861549.1 CZB domain-containing protein [Undibacterium jejuense]
MDLNNAIAKHSEWKTKLRSAITRKETLDASTISKDNCCDLGKWLHGEAKSSFGHLAAHSDCVKKHAEFHVQAGKVASAINEKKYTEAEAMIEAGTPYTKASSAIGVAILHLKKEAGI